MTFRPFFALILAVVLIISLSYPVMAQGADDRSARPVAERIKKSLMLWTKRRKRGSIALMNGRLTRSRTLKREA